MNAWDRHSEDSAVEQERRQSTRATVLGRPDCPQHAGVEPAPSGVLGRYRAPDGSDGAVVEVDFDRPHAGVVVGKRGSGKSHTLGVIAEGLAETTGVAPVVLDPMGELDGLSALGVTVRDAPAVHAGNVPPSAWPSLVGLEADSPAGTLVWQAATAADSLGQMREHVAHADVTAVARRGAANHLRLADSWNVFDPSAPEPQSLARSGGTVLDLSGLSAAPANAVCRAVADGLYRWRASKSKAATTDTEALPWLLIDEAHAFFDGIAESALRRVVTQGRTPGVSVVVATQRPGALPPVATAQADLLVAHRLTATPDVDALETATPTYLSGVLRERLPRERGCAVVIDDATESVHGVRVRERRSPHGGATPRASAVERAGSAPVDMSAGDNESPSSRAVQPQTETPESVGSEDDL